MKKIYFSIVCMLLLAGLKAQSTDETNRAFVIKPFQLAISESQTTNLIFPFPIRRAYCANRLVDIQQMKDVKNILLIRAAKDFTPTNLSIVTGDGKFYSFFLSYSVDASHLNIRFDTMHPDEEALYPAQVRVNDLVMQQAIELIKKEQPNADLRKRVQGIRLDLSGLYRYQNLMWMDLKVKNNSLADYSVDYLKVFVKDRVRSKTTIQQEWEMTPLFIQLHDQVKSGQESHIFLAFEPFPLSRKKILCVQLAEKNNGRFIELRARHGSVNKARTLF